MLIQYQYLNANEIFKNMLKIQEYGIFEFLILIFGIIFIITMVFYIIPIAKIYFKNTKKEREKREKKRMIDKIILQKNLEDIVRKEVDGIGIKK